MTSSSDPAARIFNPKALYAKRARALRRGVCSFVRDRALEDIAERLAAANRTFEHAAVFDWTGSAISLAATAPGKARRWTLLAHPLAPALRDRSGGVDVIAGDACEPPLADQSADLIVSLFDLHWSNDPPGALIRLRRALRPDGLLLAAFLGEETLMGLRSALQAAEIDLSGGAGRRVSPMIDARTAGGLLQRAGFALPVADVDRVRVRYGSASSVLDDLRGMGETACFAAPAPALRPAVLERAAEELAKAEDARDGKFTLGFEIVHLTAWAPHPSQPKPLKPGSASFSLAEAVKGSSAKGKGGEG